MNDQFSRTRLIFNDSIDKLKESRILIFGIGGVGGYVCEALARIGVSNFILVDNDIVSISNINRQIIATHNSIGMYKCDVMKERILSINPDARVELIKRFMMVDDIEMLDFDNISYIVDAIDTISTKIKIIEKANQLNIPIISSMGTGNKINPTMLEVTDIYKTKVDPIAKVLRKELKSKGVKKLKVVYSKELPIGNIINDGHKRAPGSNSFVPSCCGLIIASEVIKDITGVKNDRYGA